MHSSNTDIFCRTWDLLSNVQHVCKSLYERATYHMALSERTKNICYPSTCFRNKRKSRTYCRRGTVIFQGVPEVQYRSLESLTCRGVSSLNPLLFRRYARVLL